MTTEGATPSRAPARRRGRDDGHGGGGPDPGETWHADVVVVGSGIGGLCCAAMAARYGFRVVVCESHTTAGGAAHSFQRDGYHFESGPSLFTGLSTPRSANPLTQVLDLLGERPPTVVYDRWMTHLPEGAMVSSSDRDQHHRQLRRFCSEVGFGQWLRLEARLEEYAAGITEIPMASMRGDRGAAITMGPYVARAVRSMRHGRDLQRPFSWLVDQEITDPFLRRLCDLECFGLSGMDAGGTPLAEMVFMFRERFAARVEYPLGGSQALVDALVRGLERHGGRLLLGAHVGEVVVEGGRARGVRLANGATVRAERAVVSNATLWDTLGLVPAGALPVREHRRWARAPMTDSIVHLHLGIDADGLPPDLGIHHMVLRSWDVTAPQNMCNICIPSTVDPSQAPPGRHVVHAYTAGNEPYGVWEGLDRRSPRYRELKEERSQVLWEALEVVIPDVRQRTEVALVGTPLTHERYLRRHRGTYGAAFRADRGERFPGPRTALPGLLLCGDSTMPGIGVPAVAMSGWIAANTLAPLRRHRQLLAEIVRARR
jgi:phytoene dehydrogenase-like protein